jgi:hypothetical protein
VSVSLTWEELESRGLCECGRPLKGHPPVPKPPPLKSWMSTRSLDPVASANGRQSGAVAISINSAMRDNALRRRLKNPDLADRRRKADNARKARERQDPLRRPHLLERERRTQRDFYERHKEAVLASHRADYAARVGHEPQPGVGRPRIL